jgi:hypothetical protein
MDLAMLGTDAARVRVSMRKDATFVIHDGARTTAAGAFGEVAVRRGSEPSACDVSSEECAAAICAELARPRAIRESEAARWRRILRQPGIGRDRKA